MTSTNKAFAYVFNTPAEDHKVARVLSGHDPEKAVALLSLDTFDAETQAKIRRVASALFGASTGLDGKVYNVNARVVDTLMAYLVAPLSVAEGGQGRRTSCPTHRSLCDRRWLYRERSSSMVFTPVLYQKQRNQFREHNHRSCSDRHH
ncbi:hypothetical protein PC123_g14023 [Phytophthora cactorum]|nr:hypothetical protein PC120_g22863 [Phytophthora cactorum]KAG4050737.1 hypothetical protein PC123_g14023 [Phytophthora cactorum]